MHNANRIGFMKQAKGLYPKGVQIQEPVMEKMLNCDFVQSEIKHRKKGGVTTILTKRPSYYACEHG